MHARLAILLMLLVWCVSSLWAQQVTLTWQNPTTNADGTILMDLRTIWLHYGTAPGMYSTHMNVGMVQSAALGGMTPGVEYFFTVTAQDESGNMSTYSTEVSKIIEADAEADTTPPEAVLTFPSDGSTVIRKTKITISATASDNKEVTHVEFYVNGALHCTDGFTPYTCQWNIPAPRDRTYILRAIAFDISGNSGESELVTVTSK